MRGAPALSARGAMTVWSVAGAEGETPLDMTSANPSNFQRADLFRTTYIGQG